MTCCRDRALAQYVAKNRECVRFSVLCAESSLLFKTKTKVVTDALAIYESVADSGRRLLHAACNQLLASVQDKGKKSGSKQASSDDKQPPDEKKYDVSPVL